MTVLNTQPGFIRTKEIKGTTVNDHDHQSHFGFSLDHCLKSPNPSSSAINGTGDVNLGFGSKERKNQATISPSVTLDADNVTNINRNVSNAQETTQDTKSEFRAFFLIGNPANILKEMGDTLSTGPQMFMPKTKTKVEAETEDRAKRKADSDLKTKRGAEEQAKAASEDKTKNNAKKGSEGKKRDEDLKKKEVKKESKDDPRYMKDSTQASKAKKDSNRNQNEQGAKHANEAASSKSRPSSSSSSSSSSASSTSTGTGTTKSTGSSTKATTDSWTTGARTATTATMADALPTHWVTRGQSKYTGEFRTQSQYSGQSNERSRSKQFGGSRNAEGGRRTFTTTLLDQLFSPAYAGTLDLREPRGLRNYQDQNDSVRDAMFPTRKMVQHIRNNPVGSAYDRSVQQIDADKRSRAQQTERSN